MGSVVSGPLYFADAEFGGEDSPGITQVSRRHCKVVARGHRRLGARGIIIKVQVVFLTAAMPPDVRKACGLP
jgi:hypothetical protein